MNNKNKKAQLKIQEMTFVLLAIIFLFALILLMFTSWQSTELKKLNTQTREARATTMLEVISGLPELRCSSSVSSPSESVCLDRDKLLVFNNNRSIQSRYSILWENSQISAIEIQEFYPPTFTKYVIYRAAEQTSTRTYATYASLCQEDPGSAQISKCTIARIKVTMNMPV